MEANKENKDILDELTNSQMAGLDESIQQVDRGETVPHEVVKARIIQLLSN